MIIVKTKLLCLRATQGADLGGIAETGFMPVLLEELRVILLVEKSRTGSTSVIERLERAD